MRKITAVIAVLAFGILSMNSCIFDPESKPKGDKDPPKNFLPLDKRDNVLHNLELAYNQRNLTEYQKLLDNDFIFHFSAADIADGNVSVAQWDRAAEIGATTNMFNPAYSPPNGSPINSISLTLTYPAGEEVWSQVTPPDPVKYPNEVWYEKTVDYILTVVAGETTFTSGNPIGASFIVRQSNVNGELIYRIVSWRDDIGN